MSDVTPDHEASLNFLRGWGYPAVLTSIEPDKKGGIETRTFSDETAVLAWLEKNVHRNIYFSVNPTTRPIDKKPSREDVAAMTWLHVDVDPRAGEDLHLEQARILALLVNPPAGVPKPTVVVFSGGGAQAFWKLSTPFPIDGNAVRYEQAARYNLQLEVIFGGDHTHNVDRIMRLPGSVNRPDERKRKKGRVEARARVVSWETTTYDLARFTPAPEVQGSDAGFGGASIKVSGNLRRLASVDELPSGVPPLLKVAIVQGHDPDSPSRWASRSECLFWVCCELIRHSVDDETIFSILTDPGFAISTSVLEKGGAAAKYALRQIERAHEEAIDPMLRKLNEEFAVVGSVGGKCRVIREQDEVIEGVSRSVIHYQTFTDFINFWCNKRVFWRTRTGQEASEQAGKWWLLHPQRREYRNIVFSPQHDIPGTYNLWKGFAVEARPGACDLYLQHVRENICSGSEELFNYLLNWMALAVQKPAQQGHTAIVLRGSQGTGKGVFAHAFGAVFGRHYLTVRDSNHLFGQFNAHLRDCLVLFADEAFWAGNKKHEGLLKSLVTEATIMSEAKGVDAEVARNYIHMIMASNEAWVVPAGVDDRRFLVLNVGDGKRQNNTFFKLVADQMKGGGHEALLHLLMTRDLADFDVRRIPQTEALREQKAHSFSPEQEWWYNKLCEGRITDQGWPESVHATHLCYDFTQYCQAWKVNVHANSTRLGYFMQKVVPPGHILRRQLGGDHPVVQMDGSTKMVSRPGVYLIPPLDVCRKWWDDKFGGPYQWLAIRSEPAKEVVF